MREFYAKYNIVNFSRQHRRADGRLVPQGIKSLAGHQGLEVPHRRLCRQGARAHRRRAAEHSRRRDLPGAREGHDRCRRVGSVPTTTKSSASTRSHRSTAYPGWWEGGPQLDFYVNTTAYNGLSAEYKAVIEAAAVSSRHRHDRQVRRSQPGRAQEAGRQRRQAVPFPERLDGCGIQGVDRALQRAQRQQSGPGRRSTTTSSAFRRDANLWFRFTEAGFDDFMQQQKL
jgi:hypothetical protein